MAKRIQFSQYGDSRVLQYVDMHLNDPQEHEVLIENKAIGVNYIDTYVRSGLYPVPSLPSSLGTEGAGVVIKIGDKVTDFKIGDRIAYCQSSLGAYADFHLIKALLHK